MRARSLHTAASVRRSRCSRSPRRRRASARHRRAACTATLGRDRDRRLLRTSTANIERGCAAGRPDERARPRCRRPGSRPRAPRNYGDAFVCRIDNLPAPKHEACATRRPRTLRGRSITPRPTDAAWTYSTGGVAELPAAAGHDHRVRVRQLREARRPAGGGDRRAAADHGAPASPATGSRDRPAGDGRGRDPRSRSTTVAARDDHGRDRPSIDRTDDDRRDPPTSTHRHVVERAASHRRSRRAHQSRTTAPARPFPRRARRSCSSSCSAVGAASRRAPAVGAFGMMPLACGRALAGASHPARRAPDRVVDLGDRAGDRGEPHDQPAAARARARRRGHRGRGPAHRSAVGARVQVVPAARRSS